MKKIWHIDETKIDISSVKKLLKEYSNSFNNQQDILTSYIDISVNINVEVEVKLYIKSKKIDSLFNFNLFKITLNMDYSQFKLETFFGLNQSIIETTSSIKGLENLLDSKISDDNRVSQTIGYYMGISKRNDIC